MRPLVVTLLLMFPILAHAQTSRPAELREVKTIDDLQRQDLIDIAGVGRVRLGMGPFDPELGPWRVVYCLQESDSREQVEKLHDGAGIPGDVRPLGPLSVSVQWEPLTVASDRIKRLNATPKLPKLPILHQTLVPLLRDGKVTISVFTPDDRAIATTTMDVKKPTESPWQRFAALRRMRDQVEPVATAAVKQERVVPRLETSFGAPAAKGVALGLAEPTLKLSRKGSAFLIDAGERELVDMPDEYLLARWWVNGKPVTIDEEQSLKMQEQARQVLHRNQINVAFGLPENLNARLGDKITLQVLYCAGGYEAAKVGLQEELQKEARKMVQHDDKSPSMAISNKLEFVATEAMLKPSTLKE